MLKINRKLSSQNQKPPNYFLATPLVYKVGLQSLLMGLLLKIKTDVSFSQWATRSVGMHDIRRPEPARNVVLVEYVPTSFGYVFHAGTHFSNTRPVECRRPAAVSDTQHARAGICSTLSHLVLGFISLH